MKPQSVVPGTTRLALLCAAAIVGRGIPASAVIKIDFPVSRVYREAAVVAVGVLARVEAGHAMECAIRETLEGRLPDVKLTVGRERGGSYEGTFSGDDGAGVSGRPRRRRNR